MFGEQEVQAAWEADETRDFDAFADRMASAHGVYLDMCGHCDAPTLDGTTLTASFGDVCQACYEALNLVFCDDCCVAHRAYDMVSIEGQDDVCDDCACNYPYCDTCEVRYAEGSEEHYHEDDTPCTRTGRDGDPCAAEGQHFHIMDGEREVHAEQRTTVVLPAGTVDEIGAQRAAREVMTYAYSVPTITDEDWVIRDKWYRLAGEIENGVLGPEFQTREGNYARRASRYAYKTHGLKIPAEVAARLGNVAREHSARERTFYIETTRDLNRSAREFYHAESCWWQSYAASRCWAKSNGSFGIRTFRDADCQASASHVTGRVWVQPIKKGDVRIRFSFNTTEGWVPTTHTTVKDGVQAFLCYNGYGEVNALDAARMLAGMHGWTYKRITFRAEPMYVNSEMAYIVGPAEIVGGTDEVNLYSDQHAELYDAEHAPEPEMALAGTWQA